MRTWRTWMTLTLMILSLGFLTAADIECESDEFEFNWPNWGRSCDYDCDGWYYYESYDCGPWCGWWW